MKGHIRERGTGNWYAVIDMRDPSTGKRKRKWHSLEAKGKREAQIECAGLISSIEGGTNLEPNKTTLASFVGHWLNDIKARVSPRTHERYAQIIHTNIIPLLGGTPLRDLRPQAISAAYTKALTKGRKDGTGGLSPRSVHHMHTVLKAALTQAVRWELLSRNPANAVRAPKVEPRHMATYDLPQTVALIDAFQGTRMFIPVLLAVLCGLRRGEIAALRWGNVNLDSGQLAVVESAEQTKAGVRYKSPKSGKGRTVALSDTIIEELRAHRISQAQDLLRFGVRQTAEMFVCTREDGLPLQPNSLTIYWDRHIAKTTLPRIRFHDLRHAHATHLLSSGIHPKVASERLGHSKVGITLDLYSHVIPGMQEDAAAKMDAALKAARRPKKAGDF
jgi:integrase